MPAKRGRTISTFGQMFPSLAGGTAVIGHVELILPARSIQLELPERETELKLRRRSIELELPEDER